MNPDALATILASWTDGLAPGTRDQLSSYDLSALYDRLRASDRRDRGALRHAIGR